METVVTIFVVLLVALVLRSAVSTSRQKKEEAEHRASQLAWAKECLNTVIPLVCVVEQDLFLCYNRSDNTFVCQGATPTEMMANFRARFPTKIGMVVEASDEVVAALEAAGMDNQTA